MLRARLSESRLLRPQAVHGARERYRFPDMVDPANPPDSSLQTEPKSRVHERSVFPEVEIPAVGLHWQSFLADSRQQLVVIVFTLGSSDDLAVALWGQTIIAKHRAGIGGIL